MPRPITRQPTADPSEIQLAEIAISVLAMASNNIITINDPKMTDDEFDYMYIQIHWIHHSLNFINCVLSDQIE